MYNICSGNIATKIHRIYIILAVSIVSLDAQSQYMNRRDQVKQEIIETIPVEAIKRLVTTGVDTVFNARSRALKNALNLLENTSTSEEDLGDDWNHLFQDTTLQTVAQLGLLADQTQTAIEEIEDNILAESMATLPETIRVLASQQGGLLTGLWRINPADVRDILVIDRRDYEQAHDSMVDRREVVRGQFRSAESNARSHRDEILKVSQAMIQVVETSNRDLKQYLNTELKNDIEPSDIDDRVSRFISDMEQALEDFSADVYDDLNTLEGSVFYLERASITMLHETSERIEEMIEEDNPPIVTAAFDETDDAMNRLHSGRPAGDIRDLADFVPAAMGRVETHLESFETVFVKFIEEFEGFFVDPVNNETADELLHTDAWQRWALDVQRMNLTSILNQIKSDASNSWGAALGGLSQEKRDDIEDILDDESDRLLDAIESAFDQGNRLQTFTGLAPRQTLRGQLQG